MRNISRLIVVAFALLSARAAGAASFTVQATVVKGCVVANPAGINFGNYDPTSPTEVSAAVMNISINCTKGTLASVKLTSPNGFAMKAGTESLNYKLYQESTKATDWTLAATKLDKTSASVGTALLYPVYGFVAPGQDVSAGTFTDTVTVVVTAN